MRWARLIAWTFEHGHGAVCGGVFVGGKGGRGAGLACFGRALDADAGYSIAEMGRLATGGTASLAQHHPRDGPTSSLGHVSMGKEQRAVCSGVLVVEVVATVLLKLGLSPSRIEKADVGRNWWCLKCVCACARARVGRLASSAQHHQ